MENVRPSIWFAALFHISVVNFRIPSCEYAEMQQTHGIFAKQIIIKNERANERMFASYVHILLAILIR